MKVLIIGANGKIGQILVEKMSKDNALEPVAMVRSKEQETKLVNQGVTTVLADLEQDFGHAYDSVGAVVFTAGSGSHTGPDKTELVDHQGAIKAIDYAVEKGISRFVIVSALGSGASPDQWPESMKHYFKAKTDADNHLLKTALDYTILRPGILTNESPTGKVALTTAHLDGVSEITRADVATLIFETLKEPKTIRKTLEVVNGETDIEASLKNLS